MTLYKVFTTNKSENFLLMHRAFETPGIFWGFLITSCLTNKFTKSSNLINYIVFSIFFVRISYSKVLPFTISFTDVWLFFNFNDNLYIIFRVLLSISSIFFLIFGLFAADAEDDTLPTSDSFPSSYFFPFFPGIKKSPDAPDGFVPLADPEPGGLEGLDTLS